MIAGKLYEIDLKILNILQQDASIEVAKLAAMVHRPPNPIYERIRKLQEGGLIKKITAILDRQQVGLPVLVVLMVRLKEQNTERMTEFENTAYLAMLSLPRRTGTKGTRQMRTIQHDRQHQGPGSALLFTTALCAR